MQGCRCVGGTCKLIAVKGVVLFVLWCALSRKLRRHRSPALNPPNAWIPDGQRLLEHPALCAERRRTYMSEHDKNLSRRKSPNHASFPRPNVLAVALLGGASAVAVRTCRTLKRLREGNKLSRVAPAPDSDFPTAPSRSLSSCMIIEPVDRADEALRLPKGETPMPLVLHSKVHSNTSIPRDTTVL